MYSFMRHHPDVIFGRCIPLTANAATLLDTLLHNLKAASHRMLLVAALAFFVIPACAPVEQEGGETVDDVETADDQESISPILIVPPLLECGTSVTVRGFIPGARIRIYVGRTMIGDHTGIDPEGQTLSITRALSSGERVTATQTVGGVESQRSASKQVERIADAYPSGLPKPNFPALYLYDCGVATVVGTLPPGGQLRVFDQERSTSTKDTIARASGVGASRSITVRPAFEEGHRVTAESQICDRKSPLSDVQIVKEAPSSLPKPTTDPIYDDANFIVVHGLVNGAKATISRGGTAIATFGAPAAHVRVHGVSVSAGDVVEIVQELCSASSDPTRVTVQNCNQLPPPRLIGPRAGDTIAVLTGVVAGSRIRIYSGSDEIGDGGGSRVAYTRPLRDGETLTVIQSLNNCTSRSVYRVPVGKGLKDPSQSGPCGDPMSFEYGHSADSDKQTSDISSYFNSPAFCVRVPMNDVPLHGVVRYPDGPGPFPLVLIVHGNHEAQDPSYGGYNYLLDLLASQCMIAVSVEEDFLNLCRRPDGRFARVSGEMDARGVVLLRHLQLWREWNRTPGHRFYSKVDMGNIGLAGHSRGGEAVVVAALLNRTRHNASDPPVGKTSHNFGFNIQSLYAIAPVDGQYDGGPISDIYGDYYIMHGSHDGDVDDFQGQKAYNRAYSVTQPTNYTKGLLWVYRANHGQWNTGWGTGSEGSVSPSPLISAAHQQHIGKIYMSAFFLSELKGWTPYRHFLNGAATFSSLPSSVTRVFQYQDHDRFFLNHYQEDTDPRTGSASGVSNATNGSLANYQVYSFSDRGAPHFLWGQTQGLIAGWDEDGREIHVNIDDEADIPNYSHLALHVGQTHEPSPRLNRPGRDQDFSVQLLFDAGTGPEVAASSYGDLVYPLVTSRGTKSVQQTIRIPFTDLRRSTRDKPKDVRRIVLRFNKESTGNLAIDEIQFTH